MDKVHTGNYDGLDRRVPAPEWHTSKNYFLSIIFLLVTNIGSTIWWAGGINSDVEQLKARPDLTERVIQLETTVTVHNKYFNRLDITLTSLDKTMSRIDREQARRKSIVDRVEKTQSK